MMPHAPPLPPMPTTYYFPPKPPPSPTPPTRHSTTPFAALSPLSSSSTSTTTLTAPPQSTITQAHYSNKKMASDPDSTFAVLASKAGPEQSLRSYHLLEALRGGDPATILPLLSSYNPTSTPKTKVNEHGVTLTDPTPPGTGFSTPLHLAIRCAKYPTVSLILSHCPQALNAQDARGQTPLHLASSLNRTEVVTLLLANEDIDDTIKDKDGKTCADVAGGSEVAGLISVSRAEFNQTYLQLLTAYINSPPPAEPSSHPPQPSQPARQSLSHDVPTPNPTHPHHNTLHKPTFAAGHVSSLVAEKLYHYILLPRSRIIDFSARDDKTGTTVLHEAVRRKDLGIVKLVIARGGDVLVRDRKGKLPVEVARDERVRGVLRQAATSEGRALKAGAGAGVPLNLIGSDPPGMRGYLSKWTNMARGYRSRWFVLEKGVLSYYRSQEDEGRASRGAISMSVAKILPPGSDGLKFEVSNRLNKSFPSFWLKGAHPVEVMRWVEVLRQNIELCRDDLSRTSSGTYAASITPSVSRRTSTTATPNQLSRRSSPTNSLDDRDDGSILGDDETFNGDFDTIPHADDFDLLANGTKAQLELTQQLLDSLVVVRDDVVRNSPDLGGRPASIMSTTGRQADVKEALRGSLVSLGGMLDEYVDAVGARERYFQHKYEKEIEAKRLWEENMKEVAAQHKNLEVELQKVGRDNTRRRRALQEVKANLVGSPQMSPTSPEGPEGEFLQLPEDGTNALPPPLRTSSSNHTFKLSDGDRQRRLTIGTSGSLSPSRLSRLRSATMHTLNPIQLEQLVDSAIQGEASDEPSEDDDEFFEAIESGAIPIDEPQLPPKQSEPAEEYMKKMDIEPYKGYEHLRKKLPIDNDNRPPVSLWAILKGSIGKDLTKISFPVFFNEPTSMLQRMAEDVEFSECLDSAAADEDPTKRIAFVAAFAMSNYSSTIGRIAKPFNPMLGETFEYVDLTKKYRYISEQVCHHPPISACIAQSPSWDYFGEVDAKSKFLGKSFEIRPTGVAHVKLRIPEAWAPDAPPAVRTPGLVTEHYSWTKVTTSVSNFLFGNPIIDHYGDMIVTNHRTGDTCTLTFKPRGWRGSGACEIKGKVVDKSGREWWDIAGKWNSQLVARRVGAGTGDLAPDTAIPSNQHASYIRLWKNSEKPPGMPFNLTPFAITLNDTNPDLKIWLPPTDCRLRPDQHAFESGEFERANMLKSELEEHQRETRRKRERGEHREHKARWFVRKRDADTGESVWDPVIGEGGNLDYWEERIRVGELKKKGEPAVWKDVEPIFADF